MRVIDKLWVSVGVALIMGAVVVHEVAEGIMGRSRRRKRRNKNRLALIKQAVEVVQDGNRPTKAERREANKRMRQEQARIKIEKDRNDYLDWCCELLQGT